MTFSVTSKLAKRVSLIYVVFFHCISYRHKEEIEEIVQNAGKELDLEIRIRAIEEEWTEQVMKRNVCHTCIVFKLSARLELLP